MAYLEDLVGKPLHEISDEELDTLVMKGRLAREEEAEEKGKKARKKSAKIILAVDLDLDDL